MSVRGRRIHMAEYGRRTGADERCYDGVLTLQLHK